MKRLLSIALSFLLLLAWSCIREPFDMPGDSVPEGEQVMMKLNFGTSNLLDLNVMGTKGEASHADECNVHDLYVFIFDSNGDRLYNRHFSHGHKLASFKALDESNNEGWYAQNATVDDVNSITKGAVKISTVSKKNCTLVMLANVTNTVMNFYNPNRPTDEVSPVNQLNAVQTLAELKGLQVQLVQDVVNRSDLFLMMGLLGENNNPTGPTDYSGTLDTGAITWGSWDDSDQNPENHHADFSAYKLTLKPLDAKIKFRVRYNPKYIKDITPRNWAAFNIPSGSYLFEQGSNPADMVYFDTDEAYFEGTESAGNITYTDSNNNEHTVAMDWQVFTFYMLESYKSGSKEGTATVYEDREKLKKDSNGAFLNNKRVWEYAPADGAYVTLNTILSLSDDGIKEIVNNGTQHALTSDARYTVHLGNFNTAQEGSVNDYDVKRGNKYTYNVIINNSKNIYVEVLGEPQVELQAGQEGSLLLTTDEIVECDAHYEYHMMTFKFNPQLDPSVVSWHVKTPFNEGGAKWAPKNNSIDATDPSNWVLADEVDPTKKLTDYRWVKFSLNDIATANDPGSGDENGKYSHKRKKYPGDELYNPSWKPGDTYAYSDAVRTKYPDHANDKHPALMDINQVILYIFAQKEKVSSTTDPNTHVTTYDYTGTDCDYIEEANNVGIIRMTAFIDEYYYERDPRTITDTNLEGDINRDLWREFVNASPREMHILSDAEYSKDGASNVILSSHSIFQRSIQSFYNTYSPDLNSLWGTEHKDEMSRDPSNPASKPGWTWWPSGRSKPAGGVTNSVENGRLNTIGMWDITKGWEEFLNYAVINTVPELKTSSTIDGNGYRYMAYSCLTRNRDNDGDGDIDEDEIRWYTASINQLVGIWVGTESLTASAHLYQPEDAAGATSEKWRAHVISSTASDITDPAVIRAEEGSTKSNYKKWSWMQDSSITSLDDVKKVSSVRCLRNIGTYPDNGEIKDISYAPKELMVDQYYELPMGTDANGKVNPNAEGDYTISFSRLNPKSIREYTAEDLPLHSEYSLHNRVYLELNMQNPSVHALEDETHTDYTNYKTNGLTMRELNNEIDEDEHNNFCPEGYRLPNMTELLVMSAYLPSSYWDSGSYPCRTYYSFGYLGTKKDTEKDKIGWNYVKSTNNCNMADDDDAHKTIRCVRDRNLTGTITGKLSVTNDRLNASDKTTLRFNFSSPASAFTNARLSISYRNAQGGMQTSPITLDSDLSLYGVSFRGEQEISIADLGIASRGNMTISLTLTNSTHREETFTTNIRVLSDVFASVKLLPCVYNGSTKNVPFPVALTASSETGVNITNWRLHIVDPTGNDTVVEKASIPGNQSGEYWSALYNYEYYTDSDDDSTNQLMEGTYSFLLEVTDSEETVTESEPATMIILKEPNWSPNPVGTYNTTQASDITGRWEAQHLTDMAFSAGDFIETNMDISHCNYIIATAVTSSKNTDVGLDNLISIGVNGIGWEPWVWHVYFPSHVSNKDYLRFSPTWAKNDGSVTYDGNNDHANIDNPNRNAPLHFRIDKNGVFWNGQKTDFSHWGNTNKSNIQSVFNHIIDADALYIGSIEGYHRSRAYYRFVRVVHNYEDAGSKDATGGFSDSGPVNGGDL